MHCNSDQKIRETLRRLATEPVYQDSFIKLYPGSKAPTGTWSRFVELSGVDPYTPERVELACRWRSNKRCLEWVETALHVCKLHDSEFSLALEEVLEDRFRLAAALLAQEGELLIPPRED